MLTTKLRCGVCLSRQTLWTFSSTQYKPLSVTCYALSSKHRNFNTTTVSNIKKKGPEKSVGLNPLIFEEDIDLDLSVPKKDDWPLRHDLIDTCQMRWIDRFEGMRFDVGYIDTNPDKKHKGPVVLAVHGAPGNHQELLPLINPLAERNIRVVAPNFPGFGFTKGIEEEDDEFFCHTADEKAEFLHDFLVTLNIKSIDLVICQGLSTPAVAKMLFKTQMAKSFVFLNPTPHVPTMVMKPHASFMRMASLWDRPRWRSLISWYMGSSKSPIMLKSKDKEELGQVLMTIAQLNFKDIIGFASGLEFMKLPGLFVYSHDDPLMDKMFVEKYLDIHAVTRNMITTYDDTGTVKTQGHTPDHWYAKALGFKKAGHFIQDKYSHILVPEIVKLLDHVLEKDKKT